MDPRKHTFSFRAPLALAADLNQRVGYCIRHHLKVSEGLVLRALLSHAGKNATLVAIVRAQKSHEKELRARRDTVRQTITFQPTQDLARRVNDLVAYCSQHGEKVSDGLVVRAIIQHTPANPPLLGYVRARREDERRTRGTDDERAGSSSRGS